MHSVRLSMRFGFLAGTALALVLTAIDHRLRRAAESDAFQAPQPTARNYSTPGSMPKPSTIDRTTASASAARCRRRRRRADAARAAPATRIADRARSQAGKPAATAKPRRRRARAAAPSRPSRRTAPSLSPVRAGRRARARRRCKRPSRACVAGRSRASAAPAALVRSQRPRRRAPVAAPCRAAAGRAPRRTPRARPRSATRSARSSPASSSTAWSPRKPDRDAIVALYQKARNFQPLWVAQGAPSERARDVVEYLEHHRRRRPRSERLPDAEAQRRQRGSAGRGRAEVHRDAADLRAPCDDRPRALQPRQPEHRLQARVRRRRRAEEDRGLQRPRQDAGRSSTRRSRAIGR